MASSAAMSDNDSDSSEPMNKHWLHRQVSGWEETRMNRPKNLFHEFKAEVFGTCIVIMFGDGVVASHNMQASTIKQQSAGIVNRIVNDEFGSEQYVNMGWGMAVAFGVMVSYESSGAHLNPAVTLANMIFSQMSFTRGLVFMVGQLLGAFLGAVMVTINYVSFKGGDALSNFYCTSPYDGVSHANAFFQEFVCTALLVAGIFAIGSGNPPVNKFHIAAYVGLLVFALGTSFGKQTGYAMNPARDLGPRLAWACFYAGYGGKDLFGVVFKDSYWLIPIIAPMVGGPVGALLYKFANHPEREARIAPATNSLHAAGPLAALASPADAVV